MIPNISVLTTSLTEKTHPSRTYKISIADKRVSGYVDKIESVKQAIYLILSIERYRYVIYSWDYGVELESLFGQPIPYVLSELPRRITEALLTDNRVIEVKDFEFEVKRRAVATTFTVVTTVGEFSTSLEVDV